MELYKKLGLTYSDSKMFPLAGTAAGESADMVWGIVWKWQMISVDESPYQSLHKSKDWQCGNGTTHQPELNILSETF